MRDFQEFNFNKNEVLLNHAEKIFLKQLQSLEGKDIEIDGVSTRGVIYNHINDLSDTEYRALNVTKDTKIERGSYVLYDDDYYINTNDVDDHYGYKGCKITKCNQMLKWRGLPEEFKEGFPCVISNDSYGSKQNRSSDFISEIDTKMKIIIQNNKYTRHIKRDMRFMFNKSQFDIFRVIDITTSVQHGLIVLITSKDTLRKEDDLVNGYAFNEDDGLDEVLKYEIEGSIEIKNGNSSTYKINANEVCTFSVDDDSICEIVSQGSNECILKAKVKDEICVLEAKNSAGVIVADKVIYTIR